MEPIDAAFEKFKEFVTNASDEPYWNSIQSEADVRMKIIDPIFVEILGWPIPDIYLESSAGKGFIDYRCTIDSLNRLIIEAKKEARDLGINADHAARFFKLNGAVFSSEAAKEGIDQGIFYCAHKGAELACLTNGRQWAVFRGSKGPDGCDIMEGQACVFGSLESVVKKFSKFYELLSYENVKNYSFRAIFRDAEGQPIRHKTTKVVARNPESKQMLKADQLSADLDRIMQAFFRDLSSKDDSEARRACFVTTDESAAAEKGLIRISEELRGKVKSLSTVEAHELIEAIKRVQEMKKNELVLLVGTKGAGKSTFIERFFADVLATEIVRDCVVVRVDLSKSGGTPEIIKWLDKNFLDAAEKAAFPDGPPTYEEIQGMFWGEYTRWMWGHAKHLYETDKTQFKIDFGRHIETMRTERPYDYIKHLLFRIVGGHAKVPCLVFDNADHFSVPFQEAVFNYAHSLYQDALCLVILPITDTTSWQLSKDGPIQSFYTDSFFLPTPPTELILRRRIDYIEKKIEEEQANSLTKPESGRGYFFNRGIRLEIDNIKGFAVCLQTLFLNTGRVATWIGRLANHDVRRCLQLTRETVSSPHIRVSELLSAYIAKTSMSVDPDDVKMAIIRSKYDIYYQSIQSFVHNLFNLVPEFDTTPLLPLRILQFLDTAYQGNADSDARFVLVTEIVEFFELMNIEARMTYAYLDAMLARGLCLSYDPTKTCIQESVKVEISTNGQQHLTWALQDWVYLESMAEVTPLYDNEACDQIRECLMTGFPDLRRSAISEFIEYVLNEDKHFCVIPKHSIFQDQERIRALLLERRSSLSGAESIPPSGRYRRKLGRITTWYQDRGFGFIRQEDSENDAFLHIKDIQNATGNRVSTPTVVEYEIVEREQGPCAVRALILNVGVPAHGGPPGNNAKDN